MHWYFLILLLLLCYEWFSIMWLTNRQLLNEKSILVSDVVLWCVMYVMCVMCAMCEYAQFVRPSIAKQILYILSLRRDVSVYFCLAVWQYVFVCEKMCIQNKYIEETKGKWSVLGFLAHLSKNSKKYICMVWGHPILFIYVKNILISYFSIWRPVRTSVAYRQQSLNNLCIRASSMDDIQYVAFCFNIVKFNRI